MNLHTLQSIRTGRRKKVRVGRGGKRGTTAGRGTKGQKARAGHKIRPAERDLIQRLPKLKGFKNKVKSPVVQHVNLDELEKRFEGKHVNQRSLYKVGLIKKARAKTKILARGNLSKALTFEHVSVSKQAREKIESAGGTIKD